ncbi:MAG: hypothetical protein KC457_10090 [Myxococcales bacterium]|nr:hypothetical protein [Myxococcales bacterium]
MTVSASSSRPSTAPRSCTATTGSTTACWALGLLALAGLVRRRRR